jgi:hypothetical protein
LPASQTSPTQVEKTPGTSIWQQASAEPAYTTRDHMTWNGPMATLLSCGSRRNEHILYTMYLLHPRLSTNRLDGRCLVEVSRSAGNHLERITMSPVWNADFTSCLLSMLLRGKLAPLLATREPCSLLRVGPIRPKHVRTDTAIPHFTSSNQLGSTVRWPSGLRR